MEIESNGYAWNFQRVGGLDQVILEAGADICHLDSLDPKLWVALSCPASGLEFDDRTLALLDTDQDGRIRIPEVVAAVKWTCARLKNPNSLIDAPAMLPLEAIDTRTPEGQRLVATAQAILKYLGKENASALTQEDVTRSAAHASENIFNGDGILPPLPQLDEDVCAFIKNAMEVMGGVEDASGEAGINLEIAEAFMKTLEAWQRWHQGLNATSTPLGMDTAETWDLLETLRDKINDYFLRTELAAYAPQAKTALNVDEEFLVPAENGLVSFDALAELPLSKIEPAGALDLNEGINPAWRKKVQRFGQLIEPVLSDPGRLTREEWEKLQQLLQPYADEVALKPVAEAVTTTVAATASIEQLGEARIAELLNSDVMARFETLAETDSRTPAAAADIAEVEQLVLYHKHLYRLLMNFVSFHDFYDLDKTAAFQAGTLYIDGRSCKLCVPVMDVDKHSTLANHAQLYLLYCECFRKNKTAEGQEKAQRTIVAAITAGDSDLLLENRNGVFIDNNGDDWDATVVRIITNPISLRQAVWEPYKRFGRLVSDQINKWASSKDNTLIETGGKKLQEIISTAPAQTQPPSSGFDISKNVGVLAAIGLAIGAIGTALASIARSLFAMQWWQFPLVILGLFLLVSGPSVVMAWLKLRKRTLGPLLEASGWAVNGQVRINYLLGTQLTCTAELPDNATRSYADPLRRRRHWPLLVFLFAILVGAAVTAGWYWWRSANPVVAEEAIAPASQMPQPGSAAQAGPDGQTEN